MDSKRQNYTRIITVQMQILLFENHGPEIFKKRFSGILDATYRPI